MAFVLVTETSLPHELKEYYPNGNLILREDNQKSFKKEVRWKDIKSFLRTESIDEVYPSYSNGENDRYVCRPSRQNGVHDGFDRRKQAVKMADVFGIEKVWADIYEGSRQHGFFGSKKVTGHRIFLGGLHTSEMKNFVWRWLKSHDAPEFRHNIFAGTMRHMHMVSKRKGMPICDYYVAGGS